MMTIALAGILGWLGLLITAVALGAAAKRGDQRAHAAFDRRTADERSAVPRQRRARVPDSVGPAHAVTRLVTERCQLCGAQR